ncbi:expressed unknown protein [Seminavis robusta]|uniref:Uncharacterized protein n=1 Tax=Seminavis robusta TaxID=568900 RepID=A0A9N8HX84_9STRA|nr:expressed unknown protein [Seminavis robusta]|eukprot:Sro2149_g316640.1 n/a (114) ;mRNA; f:13114-13455
MDRDQATKRSLNSDALSQLKRFKPDEQLQVENRSAFLEQTDLWIDHILPFLGMGHYIFVAAVNRRMRELYMQYCDSVQDPPTVHKLGSLKERNATATDTLYSSVLQVASQRGQ